MAENTIDNVAKISVKFEADRASLSKLKDNWQEFSKELEKTRDTASKPVFNTVKNEIIELNTLIQGLNININKISSNVNSLPKGNLSSIAEEMRKIQVASKQMQESKKSNSIDKEFKNYQAALTDLENKAAQLNYQINHLKNVDKTKLRLELEKIKNQYKELNKESADFRKNIGIQWSRGFYDLNSKIDYFRAKIRSKFTMMSAERLMDVAFTAPGELVNSLSQLEQAKVNFAQVMPDSFSNNQRAMNEAMREFIKVAADYGTEVEKVTEAGRLWGRQYKDVGIVQELVRNSTKLSITDNMSLTEVNKSLEATMQQYGIKLKDTNEAQQVSGEIVDKWAHLADTAVVTAADLATANEQSAGAAHQAGLSFDFLQGIIATMATRTGKSGAEVGRSIRSMLVSMNTAKARKEFAALGIALETVDNNGVKHLRNMEDVIVELMQKLKDSNKDIRDTVLAMSGGKFQYNNVLAFLTAYDEFQKNLNLSKNSAGWADEQVKLQYETLDKQIVALKADLQGLIQVISETGASEGIRELIGMIRSFVQAMQKIDPTKITSIAVTIKNLVLMRVGLKAVTMALSLIPFKISAISNSLRNSINVIYATSGAVNKLSLSFALLNRALGIVGLVVTVIQAAMAIYDGFLNNANGQRLEEALGNARVFNDKREALENLKKAQEEYNTIAADSTAQEEDLVKANENVKEAINSLLPLLDEESRARLENAGFTKQAVESEIEVLKNKLATANANAIATTQFEISQTEAVISGTLDRIQSYQKEIEAIELLIQARQASADNIRQAGFFGSDFIAGQIEKRNERDKQAAEGLKRATEEARKDFTNNLKKLESLKGQMSRLQGNVPKGSSVGGSNALNAGIPSREVGEPGLKGGKGSGGSGGSGDNYAAKAERLKYQKTRNELWYDGKIAAQKYSNELKKLSNAEEINGITAEISGNRLELHNKRLKELTEYQGQLESFRKELEEALDAKMEGNPELAKELGYVTDLTTEQKLRIMEVNKETFQEMKSFTEISKMISEVNSKIEDTEGKIEDVNKALNKTKLSMKPDDVYNRISTDLKNRYETAVAERSGYNSPMSDYQNNIDKIQYLSDLYVAQMARVNAQRKILSDDTKKWSEQDYYNEKTKLQQWELEAKQTMANVRQAKLDSTVGIREGLADVTTQLLFEGNSWKDIWKKLWQELAKDAILSLLKVQHQASILGLVMQAFGLFGGGGGKTVSTSIGSSVVQFPRSPVKHMGGNINAFPKMHSGGDVQRGQLGVVPKLRNDEVLRTLQVGEEVNSIADRRSNEILGAVAMKALDEKNQMPSNIQIFAMDSKSFAEYLNENAEVLIGVLAKNKALNRQ